MTARRTLHIWNLVIGLAAAGSLFAVAPQPPGWVVLFRDDFEAASNSWQVGSAEGAATWERVKDGNNTVYSGQGHVWLRLPGQNWSDFRFRSRIKFLQGNLHINYRVNGCGRYFLNFGAGGLRLSKTALDCTSGFSEAVTGKYSLGTWYEVEIVGIGGNLKIYVNSVLKMEYTDPDPLTWGGIAFESLDSRVLVDAVEVTGPAPVEFAPWTKVGGPHGGIGYDVRMRPDNPDVMFVTDAFSGVHISRDGGRTWAASNQGITSRTGTSGDAIPIFCLTIDPNRPDTVWTGTTGMRGVFKSTDGGRSWVEKTAGMVERNNISFRGISVDPNDSNTVYAAGEIGVDLGKYFGRTKGVVYRTRDGGENWTAIWRGGNLARYVLVDPRNSRVLYISTGIFDREAADADLFHDFGGGVGIVKTTDGGQTWQTLGLQNGLNNLYVGSLFMHPGNPDVLLAGTGMNNYRVGAGIYLSTDQGAHWQQGVFADTGQPIADIISSVEIASSDPRIAYAANTSHFFRSEDGGRTWKVRAGGSPMNYGPPGAWIGWPIDIQVDPHNPDRLFINSYQGGVFLSEDGGATWQMSSRGYSGASVYKVAVDPADRDNLYTVAFSGPFHSLDGGRSWAGLLSPPATAGIWSSVAIDPSNSRSVLLADSTKATLFRSEDGGAHWDVAFIRPLSTADAFSLQGFKAIAFAPSNPRTVYAGLFWDRRAPAPGPNYRSFGFYKSLDGGSSWFESNDAVSERQSFNKLAVDPRNESRVYGATLTGGVIKSADGGRTWQTANQGIKGLDVRTLALDPRSPWVLYAGLENGGLYKSSDAGATWQMSAAGMDPLASVRDIVVDPVNPQTVYAADARTGVYRSVDGGKLWQLISKDLTTRAVNSLDITADGGTLYAGTDGEGVFRLDLIARNRAPVSATSAASFADAAALAPDSIASAFGDALADRIELPPGASLPTTTGGTGLSITDAAGAEKAARLFFVSPGQINFLVPPGLAEGPAVIRIFRQGSVVARGATRIAPVAPSLFTANANGQGAPAALAARYGAGGAQTAVPVFQCSGTCAPVAMDLGEENEQLILSLYATGLRAAREVTATIGGVDAPVLGFAAQSQYAGLDQVNVRLPRELKGRGEVDLVLKADGKAANTVRVSIR